MTKETVRPNRGEGASVRDYDAASYTNNVDVQSQNMSMNAVKKISNLSNSINA